MYGCVDVWMYGCVDVWMCGCLDVYRCRHMLVDVREDGRGDYAV